MRGQGRVYRPMVDGRESQVWWLDYGVNGQRYRESSKLTSKREALALLRDRIGKRQAGSLTGRPDRVTRGRFGCAADRGARARARKGLSDRSGYRADRSDE